MTKIYLRDEPDENQSGFCRYCGQPIGGFPQMASLEEKEQ